MQSEIIPGSQQIDRVKIGELRFGDMLEIVCRYGTLIFFIQETIGESVKICVTYMAKSRDKSGYLLMNVPANTELSVGQTMAFVRKVAYASPKIEEIHQFHLGLFRIFPRGVFALPDWGTAPRKLSPRDLQPGDEVYFYGNCQARRLIVGSVVDDKFLEVNRLFWNQQCFELVTSHGYWALGDNMENNKFVWFNDLPKNSSSQGCAIEAGRELKFLPWIKLLRKSELDALAGK